MCLFIYLLLLHYLFTHIAHICFCCWVHNLTLIRYVNEANIWGTTVRGSAVRNLGANHNGPLHL
jgi:hypothetical protein